MARLLALALLALLVAAGCGGAETVSPTPETVAGDVPTAPEAEEPGDVEGDPAAGKDLYLANDCGSCHTLADAGTTGQIGPSLDSSSATFDAAVQQITNGGGGMPAYDGRLSEEEIANVAAYVVTARG